MSTLKADTIQSTSGGAATLTKQSAAKAWLYGPATVASISASFNISSVDDDGTGMAGMNLTSSMSSANYVAKATHQSTNVQTGAVNNVRGCAFHSKSASAMEARTYYVNNDCYTFYEGVVFYNVSAHGDLA